MSRWVDSLGLWVDSVEELTSGRKKVGASSLLALDRSMNIPVEDYGRHNYISRVFCVPDKNDLPPIDGFAGSSYPTPPYFASVEGKLRGTFGEVRNGTKPLADNQILRSTGILYIFWENFQKNRSKLGFCPKEGGSDPIPTFSKSTKTQFALELPINVGILSQYGGGSPVPTKKSPKMT